MTSLYKQLKEHLPKGGAILSDKEFILLNRKDYNINQLAPVQAILESINITVGYPFRVLLSFIDSLAAASKVDDFNIILSDPSMAVAAYVAWVRSGGNLNKGKIYAPKGIPLFPSQTGIVGDMIADFTKSVNTKVVASKNRRPYITGELLLAARDIKNLRLKHEKRFYGKSNYTFKSLSNLFIQIILNYSLLPLRLVVRLAFVLSIATIVLVIYGVDRNDLMMLWLLSSVFMIVIIAKYIEKLFLNVIFPLQYQVKNVFRNEIAL